VKRYPSGLITADPIALTASGGYSVSSIDQLQYNFSGAWFLPPFPTYGNLLKYNTYYNDKTDYLGIPANSQLTTFPGDFTVECWVFLTDNTPEYAGVFDARQDGQTPNPFVFGLEPLASPVSGSWRMIYYNGSANYGNDKTVFRNQWTHLAWARLGSTMTFYVNGESAGTSTISGTQTASASSNPVIIGTKDSGLSNYGFIGYISNFRIVKGTAVYTSTFTPPTSPLTAIANTSLLTCQTNTFIDSSLNNFNITNSGTLISDFNPFDKVEGAYLAVAGGGGGGGQGGGGGAGGLLYRTNLIIAPNVTYTITIGAGAASVSPGSSFGSPSTIRTAGFAANITVIGGGAGQSRDVSVPGGVGGSGGGGGAGAAGGDAAGKAGTLGQGNSGAPGGFPSGGGGGGGAGAAGNGGSPYAGNGGAGVYLTISGSNVAYAGGGGGGGVGGYNSGGGAGGIGGGGGGRNGLAGGGGFPGGTPSITAAPGTYGPGAINTGGGGGGDGGAGAYLGGSGIVILSANGYAAANVTGDPNVTYNNFSATYRFWQSGTIRW